MNEKIFSYGTLQYDSVQISIFGRKLIGKADKLIGYQLSEIVITDPHVISVSGKSIHKILSYSSNQHDTVSGTVFDVTKEELEKADQYEVSDYKRVLTELSSGDKAWVYVLDDNCKK